MSDLFLPNILKAIAQTAKSGSTCTADVGGEIVTVEVARDLTVAAGDALLLARSGAQYFALGRYSTAAPAAPSVPVSAAPRPVAVQTGRLIITPIETRSRQGSKWRTDTTDVYQGQYGGNGNHVGCAFYGRKAATVSGATCTGAAIKVRRLDKGGTNAAQDTTLRLITERFRPSGAPTLTSTTDGPNLRRGQTDTYVEIPTSWGQAMLDGTSGGLAVYESDGSPYVILAGRESWGPAWALTISWRR
jgi:hypothetical protein